MSARPTPAPAGRTLLNYAEVAHKLGVGVTKAKKLAKAGEIKKVWIGGSVRFLESDVDEFIRRQLDAA